MKFIESIGVFFGGLAVICGGLMLLAVLIGFPVMWLWNYVMPVIFGLPAITFWQAVALFFLFQLFFNSSISNKDQS